MAIFKGFFCTECPKFEWVVPNSTAVKIIISKAIHQIPKRVKEAVLLNLFRLLDKMRSPITNTIKNGIPINVREESVNSQRGSEAAKKKSG